MQFEIDLSEHCQHFGNGYAVLEEFLGKLGLMLLDPPQAIEAVILYQMIDEGCEPAGEKEQHVMQRQEAGQSARCIEHWDTAQVVPPHCCYYVEERGIG